MGNQSSSEYQEHRARFTNQEFSTLKSSFTSVCLAGEHSLHFNQFNLLFGLTSFSALEQLGAVLFAVFLTYGDYEGEAGEGAWGHRVRSSSRNAVLSVSLSKSLQRREKSTLEEWQLGFQAFINAMGETIKGSRSERNWFLYQLLKKSGIEVILRGCIYTIMPNVKQQQIPGIVQRIIRGSPWWRQGKYNEDVSFQEFVRWEESVTIIGIIILHILGRPGVQNSSLRILGLGVTNSKLRIGQFPELLSKYVDDEEGYQIGQFDTWLLALTLPYDYTETWTQIYHSQRDGRGLSNFMNATKNIAATLIIIEDIEGNVFGAFTADKWERRHAFYGHNGLSSFLFCLQPAVKVFHATGNDSNFQWSAQRCEGVPLGLGFGGQVSNFAEIKNIKEQASSFALFIDSDFEWGYAGPSATYANEYLAGPGGDFMVKSIECWQVSGETDDNVWEVEHDGSVSDHFEKEHDFATISGQEQKSDVSEDQKDSQDN
eukprot:TRINITY_DN55114_c0_g1_i1.p1 TRINITY_DN55114_c0_g1~~TRINITY_DN55114_c0_g1_i1.p1  ORF type:complete len:507 (+),score=62.71 TRINITY_DN55114_c0_g1_i1:66-1523(+)